MIDQHNVAKSEFVVSLDAEGLLTRARGDNGVDLRKLIEGVPTIEILQASDSGFLHVRIATAFAESLLSAIGDVCVIDEFSYLELYGEARAIDMAV